MRLTLLLALVAWQLRSDLARPYPSGKEPSLLMGTAASNAAGAGVQFPPGKELAHNGNQHLGHVYKDLAQ